jgi:hypothetical protein
MQTQQEDNNKYLFSIIRIILLTNIPAFIFVLREPNITIGWMTGSLASAVCFYLKARLIFSLDPNDGKANMKKVAAGFLLRYLFLIVWSLLIILLVRPDLIVYCLSLLSAQIAIVIHHIYVAIKNSKFSKYFDDIRG